MHPSEDGKLVVKESPLGKRQKVVPRRVGIPPKLFRTPSRFSCGEMLYKVQSKSSGTSVDGQHFSCNLHQQDGGNPLPHSITSSQQSLGLVSQSQCVGNSSIHPGSTECRGRQRIQSIPGFQRLETKPNNCHSLISNMGPHEYQPVCFPSDIPNRPVCESETRPTSSAHRCIHPELTGQHCEAMLFPLLL